VTRLWDRLTHRAGYWEGMASGAAVLTTSYSGTPDREGPAQSNAWAQSAHANSAVVFSAMQVRAMVFSEAVFKLQAMDDKHLFGNASLRILEEPWPDGSSGDLLAWMEKDTSLAGNAYIWQPPGEGRLVRLRPDWTTIVSELIRVENGTDKPGWYRNKIGYWHEPPRNVLDDSEGFFAPAGEVAHWVPTGMEDPVADFRGQSWLTKVMREVQADDGLTQYKIRYLQNAATPNLLIKYPLRMAPGTVDSIRERVGARYGGVDNAFKTLVLDQGADTTIVGNSLHQMDYGNVAAAGEQRILAASGVPGVLVGLEPLRGAGRGYQESIAKFANMTMRPLWRSACKALSKFVDDPSVQAGGSRLWFDTTDIAMLQDGEMERGQAALVRMQALLAAVQAGYTHESAVAAVDSMDVNQLKAGGLGPPSASNPVQHMLPQPGQPGATASPLPPAIPRLDVGPVSPGGGGQNTRPIPRPAAGRRALTGANGGG